MTRFFLGVFVGAAGGVFIGLAIRRVVLLALRDDVERLEHHLAQLERARDAALAAARRPATPDWTGHPEPRWPRA